MAGGCRAKAAASTAFATRSKYIDQIDSSALLAAPRPIAGLSETRHGAFSDSNYEGNVGSGLLKRYVATFDYSRRMLFLKPTKILDQDVGAFDRVGMWINLGEAGMTVMDLAAHGPAEKCGLKVGDVIIAIDGTAVLTRSLSDVRRSLKIAPVGRAITVTYSHEGASNTTQVVPRNLIAE